MDKIHEDDRNGVKRLIVNLMLKSPESIQRQLSDAISVIGREDFPKKWPDLLNEMIEKFGSGDFHVINGILHTAHSLFKRYRYEFKSNDLWLEIKYVMAQFAPALTQLFVVCFLWFSSFHLFFKLFFNIFLNCIFLCRG